MKKISLIFLIFLFSCEDHNYYTIASPNKDKCITTDFVTSLRPEFKSYVKIYYGTFPLNKKEYVTLLWENISGFAVDWGSNPIKLTDGIILENTMPDSKIQVKEKMSQADDSEFHKAGSLWRPYVFTLISSGEYESCK